MKFFLITAALLALRAGASIPPEIPPIREERLAELAGTTQWLKLVHYKKNVFGRLSSEVAGESFFLSMRGSTDPLLELKATWDAFFLPADKFPENRHPLCRFPARRRYLTESLRFPDSALPKAHCPLYEIYLKRLEAKSVSLVFSSFFLNNPASAFGHVMLRINKRTAIANELLDFGIGYGADVTTDNPFLYAFLGLTGGFRGVFTNVPYYYKVREYNDREARDLWSYDLGLAPEEVSRLVDHLWELGDTYYSYYFLTQNCAYHLVTTLEAAAPRLRIADRLPFYVIPTDSIKAMIEEPGLVRSVTYRPSVRSRFLAQRGRLSGEEDLALTTLLASNDPGSLPATFTAAEKAEVLDTALDYFDYKFPENLLDRKSETADLKQKFLVARASLGVQSTPIEVEPPVEGPPHSGHGSMRLGLGMGTATDSPLYSHLEIRFALHDWLDPRAGYPRSSQLEFGYLAARYGWAAHSFRIEEATLFRATSLVPQGAYQHGLSWRAELGGKQATDRNCDRCVVPQANLGVGYAVGLPGSMAAYALLEGELGFSPALQGSSMRLGAGPTLGVIASPWRFFSAGMQAHYGYLPLARYPDSFAWSTDLRWHFGNRASLRAVWSVFPIGSETMVSVLYFF